MIDIDAFCTELLKRKLEFFVGIPDSLLSEFSASLDRRVAPKEHIIAANEGNAVAIAIGYHLATGNTPVVYMQNSGLGNAINPLVSLADKTVYEIPILLIIGWRGEPEIADEPQHRKQGAITQSQLDLLDIPYIIIGGESNHESVIDQALEKIRSTGTSAAILVTKNTFLSDNGKPIRKHISPLLREAAINEILDLAPDDLIVATTGKSSRELMYLRAERNETKSDFLCVGGMGHASSVALGILLGAPNRQLVCLDGDGSMIMHMGALATIGSIGPVNLVHVIFNNAAHESVGGQRTVAAEVDIGLIGKALGYKQCFSAETLEDIREVWPQLKANCGPVLIEIRVANKSRANLGRPSASPRDSKANLQKVLLNR